MQGFKLKLKIIYHKHLLVETWFTVAAAAGVRLRYGEGMEAGKGRADRQLGASPAAAAANSLLRWFVIKGGLRGIADATGTDGGTEGNYREIARYRLPRVL